MAEHETAATPSNQPESKPAAPPARDPAECPKIRSAADAVRCAEAELKKARELYEKVRHEATDRIKSVREKSLGDVLDGTLAAVKKHPGLGVLVFSLLGFFLGRWLKK